MPDDMNAQNAVSGAFSQTYTLARYHNGLVTMLPLTILSSDHQIVLATPGLNLPALMGYRTSSVLRCHCVFFAVGT
jgi:hypothetical protein